MILDVESLIIRALSLNLVKGTIDEVDEKVHMTWVQPRVLSVDQVRETTPPTHVPYEFLSVDRQNAPQNQRLGQGSRRNRENDGRKGSPHPLALKSRFATREKIKKKREFVSQSTFLYKYIFFTVRLLRNKPIHM